MVGLVTIFLIITLEKTQAEGAGTGGGHDSRFNAGATIWLGFGHPVKRYRRGAGIVAPAGIARSFTFSYFDHPGPFTGLCRVGAGGQYYQELRQP